MNSLDQAKSPGQYPLEYPVSRAFLSGSPLSCTMSFASLEFRVVVSLGDVNKPTTRNTRGANDIVHAKGLDRKKRSPSRVPLEFFLRTVTRQCRKMHVTQLENGETDKFRVTKIKKRDISEVGVVTVVTGALGEFGSVAEREAPCYLPMIGWQTSRHFLDQWETKPKPILCLARTRFAALDAGCTHLLRILIGLLCTNISCDWPD